MDKTCLCKSAVADGCHVLSVEREGRTTQCWRLQEGETYGLQSYTFQDEKRNRPPLAFPVSFSSSAKMGLKGVERVEREFQKSKLDHAY